VQKFVEPVDAESGVVDGRVADCQAEHEVSEPVVGAAPSSSGLPDPDANRGRVVDFDPLIGPR
jgi:hypothetical protein